MIDICIQLLDITTVDCHYGRNYSPQRFKRGRSQQRKKIRRNTEFRLKISYTYMSTIVNWMEKEGNKKIKIKIVYKTKMSPNGCFTTAGDIMDQLPYR